MQYEFLSKYVYRCQDSASEISPGEQQGGKTQHKDASLGQSHLSFRRNREKDNTDHDSYNCGPHLNFLDEKLWNCSEVHSCGNQEWNPDGRAGTQSLLARAQSSSLLMGNWVLFATCCDAGINWEHRSSVNWATQGKRTEDIFKERRKAKKCLRFCGILYLVWTRSSPSNPTYPRGYHRCVVALFRHHLIISFLFIFLDTVQLPRISLKLLLRCRWTPGQDGDWAIEQFHPNVEDTWWKLSRAQIGLNLGKCFVSLGEP